MQTLTQIREMLESAGLSPRKALGQNFLIDMNLMAKLVELADIRLDATVLEVGPGTGSLTGELLARALRVVCIEIDRGLTALLADQFAGRENFTLIGSDILAGKHRIAPEVAAALGARAQLVSNLPYNVATPLVAQCLIDSWRVLRASAPEAPGPRDPAGLCLFDRLTFTVQREVADRFGARVGEESYGQVSVIVAAMGNVTPGAGIPASAFWPRPNVASRMVRIDFDPARARRISNVDSFLTAVNLAFAQRRKQIGSIVRRKAAPFTSKALAEALEAAGIDATLRPEQVPPEQYVMMSNALAGPSAE